MLLDWMSSLYMLPRLVFTWINPQFISTIFTYLVPSHVTYFDDTSSWIIILVVFLSHSWFYSSTSLVIPNYEGGTWSFILCSAWLILVILLSHVESTTNGRHTIAMTIFPKYLDLDLAILTFECATMFHERVHHLSIEILDLVSLVSPSSKEEKLFDGLSPLVSPIETWNLPVVRTTTWLLLSSTRKENTSNVWTLMWCFQQWKVTQIFTCETAQIHK